MKRAVQLLMLLAGLSLLIPAAHAQMKKMTFDATLAGKNQVPPVDSSATGRAMFRLSKSGKSIAYTITVNGIEGVRMAHIHLAAEGQDGPPVVWLYGNKAHPAKRMGKINGMLVRGIITARSLVGPMKGKPLSALVAAIRDGNTYVNVHTKAHPAGELRGQIE